MPSPSIIYLDGECAYERTEFEAVSYHHLFSRLTRTFPSGLLPRVQGILEEMGYVALIDRVEYDHQTITYPVPEGYEDRPYQEEAVNAATRRGFGIIRVATGGGKTYIAGRIMEALSYNSLFLVHTKDLLYQAIEMFSDMFGAHMVGQVGDGEIDLEAPITVATIQTVSRAMGIGYTNAWGDEDDDWHDEKTQVLNGKEALVEFLLDKSVVFMDECHRVAAPIATEVLRKLEKPRYRYGLSASPWRDDGADLALEASFGPVIFDINASTLADQGFLVAPIIRFLDVPSASYARGTPYNQVYKEYIVENEDRNQIGVNAAVSMVHRGKPTMILVRHIKHGKIVQEMVSEALGTWVPFLSGKDSSLVRNRTISDIRTGKIGLMVASTIADEGLDIRPLSGLVLLGGGKSSVRALQRVGRTLRPWPGKENAEIIDFNDRCLYLLKHSYARNALYDTEPAWTVTDF